MIRYFHFLLYFVLLQACKSVPASKAFQNSLFTVTDHTKENMFSNNIEGPAVDKNGRLFVVNFLKDGTIGLIKEDGTGELFVQLPGNSIGNSIQFNKDGNMLVADFIGHNVLLVDVKTKAVSAYCHNDAFNQPNDLCINKKGQVFASDPNWKVQTGKLWRIDTDSKPVLLKDNMGTTNGICLSPDEKTLYLNESAQRRIWSFKVDEQGNVSDQKLFTSFNDFGLDGMKCDVKGNLFVCRYGKGAIAIFSPEGKEIQEVMLKGKNVSNLTFGGKDFRTCYVTLQDRKAIEKFRTDIPGR
jgi:sugar lactone lactonase YvrE